MKGIVLVGNVNWLIDEDLSSAGARSCGADIASSRPATAAFG